MQLCALPLLVLVVHRSSPVRCQQTCHLGPPGKHHALGTLIRCHNRLQCVFLLPSAVGGLCWSLQLLSCFGAFVANTTFLTGARCGCGCHRVFELPLIGGPTPGNYTITGTTTTPDSNPGNDAATTKLSLIATCVNPLGTSATLTCPSGQAYVGPDDKQINSSDAFAAKCCVSVSLVTVTHGRMSLSWL